MPSPQDVIIMIIKFNTDTQALESRLDINKSSALYDLEEWIFKHVPLRDKMKVLDIGCGTGKQIFALQEYLSSDSEIIGIDLSADAVVQVNKRAKEAGFKNIKGVKCAIDDVVRLFEGRTFDLIISTYAIYYSSDLPALLCSLKKLLSKEGQVFVCGFGKGSNQEVYDLVNALADKDFEQINPILDFISREDIAKVARSYSKNETMRLENKIMFQSPEDVVTWWKNHNSFVPDLLHSASEAVDSYFQTSDSFPLSKNVLGIRFEL